MHQSQLSGRSRGTSRGPVLGVHYWRKGVVSATPCLLNSSAVGVSQVLHFWWEQSQILLWSMSIREQRLRNVRFTSPATKFIGLPNADLWTQTPDVEHGFNSPSCHNCKLTFRRPVEDWIHDPIWTCSNSNTAYKYIWEFILVRSSASSSSPEEASIQTSYHSG